MARRWNWALLPLVFAFYLFLSAPKGEEIPTDASNVLADLRPIQTTSLTALFPVTSLAALPNTLSLFLRPAGCVSKVVVVCPESLLAQCRATVRELVRSAPSHLHHPDISIHSWRGVGDSTAAVLQAAGQASTKWLLLMDNVGFDGLSERTRDTVLCPVAPNFPTGPRGVLENGSCVSPSPHPRLASYLMPPFTLPKALVQQSHRDWSDLGRTISQSRLDRLGGIVRGYGDHDAHWCNGVCQTDLPSSTGFFVFLLSDIDDLRTIMPLPCALDAVGHSVRILLHSHPAGTQPSICDLRYETIPYPLILEEQVDVVFAVDEHAVVSSRATIIRVPREDLQHVHWMETLTLIEWMNWNVPQIDVSIITHDRPQSLERLMTSLSQAKFFGDSINLRINMEQSSDLETIRVVGAFNWKHGSMFVHRRVVLGGLLPAVVESWYPHSNDSYGLLLEDDVELSPLFYAWIKMGILRYRYGKDRGRTGALFGISLYQQNNIELHPEGRRPFDARSLFKRSNVADPSTPYLSQIPCSWGAVYFPEHWREFHDYLAARLSEASMPIEQIVVPDVRSNHWTKSWKKYFIEMVYLRGYVMLYPNYEGFESLSTNHLEVGSHVKERSKEKQDVFRLPLMKLSDSGRLLELPGRTLPRWVALPVLNLTGWVV
ncbi:hypothetical protein FB45DRAFT_925409, partial [Roridomyces roridus]